VSRRTWLVVGAVVVVAVGVTIGVLATSDAPSVTVPTVALQGPPVPSSTTTPAVAAAVLGMGRLDDPANTFYQLLTRPAGAAGWKLETPPGVADNGGLVVGSSVRGDLTAGFLPAADLTFSVLASRPAGSSQWAAGDVPGTLAAEPDALATGPAGQVAAVLSGDGTPVEQQAAGATSWTRLTTAGQLSAVAGGCRVTRVTSVAVSTGGTPFVGTRCTGTSVGVFVPTSSSGGWTRLGPTLGASGVSAATVLRLTADGPGVDGLVEGSGQGRSSLVGLWGDASGLVASAPLTVPSGWTVRATATGGAGGSGAQGLAVLLGSRSSSALRLTGVSGPGQPWVSFTTPPSGTTDVALVGGEVDAFVPSGSNLHVWSATGTGSWHEMDRLTVPIQYGSSD